MDNAVVTLFRDSPFANGHNDRSQLGYVLLIRERSGNIIGIHFASSRCRRVTMSPMESEIHSLVLGFDTTFTVRYLIEEITGNSLQIEALSTPKKFFDVIPKQGRTN